jgi:hypothetical protein
MKFLFAIMILATCVIGASYQDNWQFEQPKRVVIWKYVPARQPANAKHQPTHNITLTSDRGLLMKAGMQVAMAAEAKK